MRAFLCSGAVLVTALTCGCNEEAATKQSTSNSAPEPKLEEQAAVNEAPGVGELVINNAHMFALAPGQAHGAVYLSVTNPGKAARQVVGISTDVAGTAMVHRTFYEDGVMRMRHIHHVKLAPKQTLVFEPNGYHIMLMDMVGVPQAGGTFTVTLDLDKGKAQTFDVAVKNRQ